MAKLNTDTSIVDYLKSTNQDSSYEARKKLAAKYGINNYTGSAGQNTSLLKLAQGGSNTNPNTTVKQDKLAKEVKPTATATPQAPKLPVAVAPQTQSILNAVTAAGKAAADKASNPLLNYKPSDPILQASTPLENGLPDYEQNAPAPFQSNYSTQIDSLLNSILNKEAFSYDMNADPLYNQYKNSYTKQADMSMRDTMGNAAALTGGYGNSYAGTVGAQAYDSKMSQLNDRIPELYAAASNQYQQGLQNQFNNLSALQGVENTDYNQYRDTVGDWQTDRNYGYGKDVDAQAQQNWNDSFKYGQLQDNQAQENWDQSFDYGVQRDNVADSQWNQSFDYGVERDNVADSQWNQSFDYNKTQDAQDQANFNSQFNYNKSQDALNRSDTLNQRAYQRQQDTLDRQASMEKYQAEQSQTQSEEKVKASTAKIDQYSKNVDNMFGASTKDEFGIEQQKYSVEDVWDYLDGSDLTDDEMMVIVNGNYELRKYVEGMQRSHSSGGGKF